MLGKFRDFRFFPCIQIIDLGQYQKSLTGVRVEQTIFQSTGSCHDAGNQRGQRKARYRRSRH